MTFLFVCDTCGNIFNLESDVNAELPWDIKRDLHYRRRRVCDIDVEMANRQSQVWGGRVNLIREYSRREYYKHPSLRYLLRRFNVNNVIEYEMVDAEYSGRDEFVTMDEIIVTCPSCGYQGSLSAYEDKKHTHMVHWLTMVTRNVRHDRES